VSAEERPFPQVFGRGLVAVRLLQDEFMAQVEEYDVRPGGEIDIVMSVPAGSARTDRPRLIEGDADE
jgi:hypothetical protein